MKPFITAIRFLRSLSIPEGPKAGQAVKLAQFQKQFVKGALANGINVLVRREVVRKPAHKPPQEAAR